MVLASLYFLFRRKVIPFLKSLKGKEQSSFKYDKISLRHFDFQELERATKNFSQDCLLGSGAFGNVYKGTFDLEGTLAIKRAHSESFSTVEEFRNEVRLLSAVKHKNLIGLVGYCEEPERGGAKILVYEYVPNGSLLEYIMGNRMSLTWKQRVNIANGAARGIAYLHEGVKPSIIHRDIKPSNILLGEGFEAKVSDFGLVKSGPTGDQSHVSSQIKGTPGYLDPAYCSSFHLTKFSDVYSFGIILLQLVSARPVVDSTEKQSIQHIIDWARPSLEKGSVEGIMDANLLCQSEACNMEVMLKMGQLALRCVVEEPKQRPTMTQVCQELEQALYSADSFNNKQSSKEFFTPTGSSQPSTNSESQGSVDLYDCSQSFVSINGVGFQKFHVDIDSLSFKSTDLRCLENNSISIDMDRI
uniref:non-specific serine/threonine protein kinase n=2 Tax=Cajanus cajan TaxID=3821 RepID=A0A151T8G1_CAJCA|nr:Receptor-like protein kinase THESEUS 1 [Cajanus cajan]